MDYSESERRTYAPRKTIDAKKRMSTHVPTHAYDYKNNDLMSDVSGEYAAFSDGLSHSEESGYSDAGSFSIEGSENQSEESAAESD